MVAPLTYYVDNHSILRWVTHQSYRSTITTVEADAHVQFRRLLCSLDIGIIRSPIGESAGLGKIERWFDDLQSRLPFVCEKYQVREFAEGNWILAEMVASYHDEWVHLETDKMRTCR